MGIRGGDMYLVAQRGLAIEPELQCKINEEYVRVRQG